MVLLFILELLETQQLTSEYNQVAQEKASLEARVQTSIRLRTGERGPSTLTT